MFAQPRHDRRRFFGMAALSLGAAWIATRDSMMHMITVKPFRPSSASDLASSVGRPPGSMGRRGEVLPGDPEVSEGLAERHWRAVFPACQPQAARLRP